MNLDEIYSIIDNNYEEIKNELETFIDNVCPYEYRVGHIKTFYGITIKLCNIWCIYKSHLIKTINIFDTLPIINITVSVLEPYSYVHPHIDWTIFTKSIIRLQYGLSVDTENTCYCLTNNAQIYHKNKSKYIIDISSLHESHNIGSKRRILLLLDFPKALFPGINFSEKGTQLDKTCFDQMIAIYDDKSKSEIYKCLQFDNNI